MVVRQSKKEGRIDFQKKGINILEHPKCYFTHNEREKRKRKRRRKKQVKLSSKPCVVTKLTLSYCLAVKKKMK